MKDNRDICILVVIFAVCFMMLFLTLSANRNYFDRPYNKITRYNLPAKYYDELGL